MTNDNKARARAMTSRVISVRQDSADNHMVTCVCKKERKNCFAPQNNPTYNQVNLQ